MVLVCLFEVSLFLWSCRYTEIEHNLLENVVFLSDFPPARHYSSTLIPGLYVQAVPYKAVKLNHTPQYRFYIIQEEKIVIRVCRTTLLPFFQLTTVAVAAAVT